MSGAALRMLLAATGGSGGSGVVLPGPVMSVIDLTATPQGGWTQIQDPKAIYYNGATYFAYAPDTGTTSDLVVAKYDHATGTTTTHVLETAYENPPDNHSSPSVIVRSSDQRVVVAASRHAEVTSPTIFISPNAEDIDGTWTEVNPDPSIGAAQYTYMVLYQMGNGDIYLFYRDYISGTNTGRLGFSKSSDGGATWAGRKILYTGASGAVPYWRIIGDGDHTVHVFTTDDVPTASKLGHFYFDTTAQTLHKSDGTAISWNGTSTFPGFADITQVRAATCWSWGGCIDALGRPATVMMVDEGGDNSIATARWRSGAWQVDEVVASVGGQVTGNQYASGAAIHHTDPDVVYLAKKATKWEMWRYVSTDDGASWTGTQITSGSSHDNIWSEVVHNEDPGLEAVWLYGDYTSDTNYAFGTRGYGTEPTGSGGGGGGGTPPTGGSGGGTYPTTLQAAINAMSPGDTLDVTGYTFHESVTISTDNITIMGCVIDGDGTRDIWADVTGDDVTLRNMTMTNAAAGAYQDAGLQVSGARFEAENLILDNGPYACMRLWPGAVDAIVTDCDMSYGPAVGLLGFQAHRATISGGRYHHNLVPIDVGNESGGMKFGDSTDIVVSGLEADHNTGPGIWLDVDCDDGTVSGNDIHHNTRSGIHFEIGDGATITGNTVYRNCSENGQNRFVENGIFVSSSRNVHVTGNTVVFNNPTSPSVPAPLDIGFISQNRAPLPHDGNVGTGNTLRSAVTAIAYDDDWAGTGHSETLTPNTLVADSDPAIAGL